MKYKFFFLSAMFSSHYTTQSVNNCKHESTAKTYSYKNLAEKYHLDKFDGMFPINKHWLITRKVPKNCQKAINKKISSSKLQLPLFNSFDKCVPKFYTVTDYIEHSELDIALLRVNESILTEYIQLGKSDDLANENLWVLSSGKKFDPLVNSQNKLMMSLPDSKISAAFSKATKKSNNELILEIDDIYKFYEWAYYLQQTEKVTLIENDKLSEKICQDINNTFSLPDFFDGVPQTSDIGGVFLITKENLLEESSKFFSNKIVKPKKLILIGLSTPHTKNKFHDGMVSAAVDLTHKEVQDWISETIFEHGVNNYDIDEHIYNEEESDDDYADTKDSYIPSIKPSSTIKISKHYRDHYRNI